MRGVGNVGEREVRRTGSVPKKTEGRSSFLRRTALYRRCGFWYDGRWASYENESFKYVRYGTETTSTVVRGKRTSFIVDFFVYPLLLLPYHLSRTAKVRICHLIRIRTLYQTQYRTKEAEWMSEWGMNGGHNSHCQFRTRNLLANLLHFRVFSKSYKLSLQRNPQKHIFISIRTLWYSIYAVRNLFGHMAGVSDRYRFPHIL